VVNAALTLEDVWGNYVGGAVIGRAAKGLCLSI
jgi:hypothetical protein